MEVLTCCSWWKIIILRTFCSLASSRSTARLEQQTPVVSQTEKRVSCAKNQQWLMLILWVLADVTVTSVWLTECSHRHSTCSHAQRDWGSCPRLSPRQLSPLHWELSPPSDTQQRHRSSCSDLSLWSIWNARSQQFLLLKAVLELIFKIRLAHLP